MYHRKPTEQEQAKAQERREKMRGICNTISAMTDADRLALGSKCLATTVEGHTLSPYNQCLVAYQFAGATVVGGFHQWRKQGRMVRKGEHCISIWVPRAPKKSDAAKSEPDTHASAGNEIHFLMGAIFDISQTEPITTTTTNN